MDKVYEWLQRRSGIRGQIVFHLTGSRCYDAVRKVWLKKYYKFGPTREATRGLLLPQLDRNIRILETFIDYYMVYICFRITLPLSQWLDRAFNLTEPTFHCLLLGNTFNFDEVNDQVAIIFNMIDLSWKWARLATFRSMDLNLIQFLYQNEENIPRSSLDLTLVYHRNNLNLSDQLFLRQVTCYKIRWHNDKLTNVYRTKSNRTREAKNQLERRLTMNTLLTVYAFLLLAAIKAPIIIYIQFRAVAYSKRYPNCWPQLEQQIQRGELDDWSVRFGAHFLISWMVDWSESLIVYVTSHFCLSNTFALSDLLNHDLLLHWSLIHQKLETLKMRLSLYSDIEDLDEQVLEVQSEIYDFFRQLRAVDNSTSDTISMTLACNYTYGTLMALNLMKLQLVQVIGVVTLLCESYKLLSLSRTVNKSYGLICSIMTLDQSIHKIKFPLILDLFSRYNFGPYYTIFHSYAFTRTTFISIFGWCASAFIMFNSLSKYIKR